MYGVLSLAYFGFERYSHDKLINTIKNEKILNKAISNWEYHPKINRASLVDQQGKSKDIPGQSGVVIIEDNVIHSTEKLTPSDISILSSSYQKIDHNLKVTVYGDSRLDHTIAMVEDHFFDTKETTSKMDKLVEPKLTFSYSIKQ